VAISLLLERVHSAGGMEGAIEMAKSGYAWSSELADVERYRNLRNKLIMYFSRRGRSDAGDLADETILRGWKGLAEGATLTAPLGAFMFGIARFVLLQKIRADQHLDQLDNETPAPMSKANPFAELLQKEVNRCLRQCWQALKPEERKIYSSFYKKRATADERDDEREELAGQLNIKLSGLRSRMYRAREKLIKCVRQCLEKKSVKQISC